MTTAFAPLRHRQFRIFIAARLISTLGNGIAPIALAFAVLDLTGSALHLGEVLAARTIGLLAFLLVGGAIADRLPRGKVLVAAGVLSAVSQGVVAALLLGGRPPVWWLVVLEAVNGAATAFAMPASHGVLPQVVPSDVLRQSNALFSLTNNGTRIGGVAVGGVLVVTVGSGWAIAIDAFSFAVAAVLFARLELPATDRSESGGLLTGIRRGWSEFASRRWLWVVVAGASVTNMAYAGAWVTLGPVIADHTFGRGWWGVVLAMTTTGLLVGSAVMMRFDPARPLLVGVFGLFGYVPPLGVLALAPHPAALAVAAFASGVGIGVFSVVWQTALHQHVPTNALSRVTSYDILGSFAALPLGQVLAGFLAVAFAPAGVVLGGAVLCVVAVLAMLATRDVREFRAPADQDIR
ncbi:hypothetical protein ALI22I_31045 [Saccharothrix sp. ALI-22-I]|uniref:MFS transporter n=1 Tax=Saccharothrix sp. ALI-22-I TaxID=1933778 RepID=UPI00097BD301|nr:MFS transporter [Saccharothrix sp. ALI-22-I]ONI84906.1 hypothetical protein ALI22I_31045 [Saccharothrix sp. ALI-22-I]